VLSGLGLLLGGAMGLALGALWIESTFPKLLGYVLDLYVPFEEIAVLAVFTAIVSLLGALWPARQAARLAPAAALRYE
jgi:lipoprotein-releasing system permease protein